MDVKRCSECGETKPIEMFAGNGRQKDGLHHTCKVCVAETYEARRQKTRENDIDKTSSLSTKGFARALARIAGTPQLNGLETKTCAKCNETKLVEMFSRSIRRVDGLNSWCRSCISAEDKAKNRTHCEQNIPSAPQIEPTKPIPTQPKRRQVMRREPMQFEDEMPRTPEQLAREAEIRRIAREERNKKALEYLHPKNPEKRAKKQEEKRKYRERTRQIMQQQAQERDEAKLTSVSQEALNILELHGLVTPKLRKFSTVEEIREYRKYRYQLRKARIKVNGGSHTKAQAQALLQAQNYQCAYCHRAVKLTKDHVIPVSQGGKNDIGNICWSCLRCNIQKNGRTPEQWIKRWYLQESSDQND
jgi:hypothetical protein